MSVFIKLKTLLNEDLKYLYLSKLPADKYERFLRKEYKKRTGEYLNIESPQKYTEKMQLSKLYGDTPLKTMLSDKYEVREWISNRIGSEYLIPLLGVWSDYSSINFDELPEKFVLKTNHSSGWNLVVNDKGNLNHFKNKIKFNRWMKKKFAYHTDLQLHYKNIKPKIIAEEYIEDSNGELNDYRFICFQGKVYYCWIDLKGLNYHYSNIYNLEWTLQPWELMGLPNSDFEVSKPENFDEMIEIATKLSKGFPHVRVDLYSVDNKIYFGEMTFTSTGGYRLISPKEYDYSLGDLWDLDKEINK